MKIILLLSIFVTLNIQAQNSFYAKTKDYRLKITKVATNLGIPWSIEFIPEHILLTDRNGFIQIINKKTNKVIKKQFNLNLAVNGQGGLLDIKKHPSFPVKPYIYFTYSKKTKKGVTTALARATWNSKLKSINDKSDVFISNAYSDSSIHFGSRIAFNDNNDIFISIGDRGHRPNAQNLKSHAGKIIKLNEDGSSPIIWSYGHRNPQGLVYDLETKKLWEMEHGPRGGDEINLIQKNKNYGWPIISYGKEYWAPMAVGESTHKKGMEQPIKQFTPSIAPCGLEIYSGKLFKKWKGNLFSGALKLRHLNRVIISDNLKTTEERLLEDKKFRIRAVKEGPDGYLYFTTDEGDLYKISPQ
jgi:glucose/arabinose dehydrogenase